MKPKAKKMRSRAGTCRHGRGKRCSRCERTYVWRLRKLAALRVQAKGNAQAKPGDGLEALGRQIGRVIGRAIAAEVLAALREALR